MEQSKVFVVDGGDFPKEVEKNLEEKVNYWLTKQGEKIEILSRHMSVSRWKVIVVIFYKTKTQ